MHGGHNTEDEPMADMNLIPMIDIALTLLIILMVTTAFIRQPGVNLKLPETTTREGAPETEKDLTIVIDHTGNLHVDGAVKTQAEVQSILRGVAQKDRTGSSRVLLKGDKTVLYGQMMSVMDMVRQAGLTKVVLPTDPKSLEAAGAGVPGASAAPATP